MTTKSFSANFESWIKEQPLGKSIQIFTENGQKYGILTLEGNSGGVESVWTIVFDSKYAIRKIINQTLNFVLFYHPNSTFMMRSVEKPVAVFLCKTLSEPTFRFNERREFVREQHYNKLFLLIDSENKLQIILGIAKSPEELPFQTMLLESFPLSKHTKSFAQEDLPRIDLDTTTEQCLEPDDPADGDISDEKILFMFADRGFA